MDELLADFVAETRDMLEASGGELVAWESNPADKSRLDAVFRFVHTVKGNCGFFDFPELERLSHAAEGALAEVRGGRRQADAALVTAVLAVIDRISAMIDAIDAGQPIPPGPDEQLISALEPDSADHDNDARDVSLDEVTAPLQAIPTGAESGPVVGQRSIRLPVELLDRVMSGVSDMVLARNDLSRRIVNAQVDPSVSGQFDRLSAIVSDMREAVTRMRMQRVAHLFNALPRLVRDLSGELGKQVMIDIEGGDVELDREMIENIRDPLTHIIRNAIDHGMETPAQRLKNGKREIGLLTIAARQSGNKIILTISDDGAGLDEAAIGKKAVANGLISQDDLARMSREQVLQLIFEPGLSTKDEATSVSGRGVGMDVVRSNLDKVGGGITTSSEPGEGTVFTLEVPLTLSIIAGLTFGVGDQRYAIPQSYVEEIAHVAGGGLEFSQLGERRFVTFRDRRVPILPVREVLGIAAEDEDEENSNSAVIVLVRLGSGDVFALGADRVIDHEDLVIKPLAPAIMATGLYAGTTLLDDGQPILMLDIPSIAQRNKLVSAARKRQQDIMEKKAVEQSENAEPVIVFIDRREQRMAVRMALLQRIETVDAAQINPGTDNARVLIDGVIYPLIGFEGPTQDAERHRLLRLSDGQQTIFYAIEKVVDSSSFDGTVVAVTGTEPVEGLAVIDGEQTLLLDGHRLFATHTVPRRREEALTCRLPDDDEWSRSILRPLIEAAGYRVIEASSPAPAHVSFCIGDDSARENAVDGTIIRLRVEPDASAGQQDTVYRYDREGVIEALGKVKGVSA